MLADDAARTKERTERTANFGGRLERMKVFLETGVTPEAK
jgi:hypothetical protein